VGNGVPIFRAWLRTDAKLRLSAAAARAGEAPLATITLSRSLSSDVQSFFFGRIAENHSSYCQRRRESPQQRKAPGSLGVLFPAGRTAISGRRGASRGAHRVSGGSVA
jgi:hypothetical protein